MYMVCHDNLPLCTVDKKGFKRLMKTVCPLYRVPHETQFSEILRDKFRTTKEIVRSRLQSISNICLTTDVWTEMMNVKSYLGITGHFIYGKCYHLDATFFNICVFSKLHVWFLIILDISVAST